MNKEYAISVGGSTIIPENEIRIPFIRSFTALIKDRVITSGQRTAIITGGGGPTRLYQQGLREFDVTDPDILDTIGIRPTHINAMFLSYVLNHNGIRTQYLPTLTDQIDGSMDAWITGGTIPGQTTDAVLVDMSQKLSIQTIINATNTKYIYDVTDGVVDTARPIKDMRWTEYLALLGNRAHKPGENVPFGITASHKAMKLGISVFILDGNNMENLRRVFEGREFEGTFIHP